MAWTTNPVTQNGNTTRTWTATGSALSLHDCIVVGHTVASTSALRIEYIDRYVRPEHSYKIRVRVVGSQAVAFRAYAEQMD